MDKYVPELQKVVDALARRLRALGAARLNATLAPYGRTTVAVAQDLAQTLADIAAVAEAALPDKRPTFRRLPVLEPRLVGDQVAVCGHDAVRALSALPADLVVPAFDDQPISVAALNKQALDQARALLRALP